MGGTPRNYQVALSDGPLTATPSGNFTAEVTCPSKLEKCERIVTRPSFETAQGNEQSSKIHDPIPDFECRPQWPAHQRSTAADTVPATVLKRLEAPVCGSSAVVDAKHSSAPPSRISSLPVPSSVAVVTSPSNAGSRPESLLPNNTSPHGEMRCTERSGSTCAVPTSYASTVSSQSRTSLAEVCASGRHAPCSSRNRSCSGESSAGVRTGSAVHNTTIAGFAANESTCRSNPLCTSSFRASAQAVKMAICGVAAVAEAPSPYTKTVITSASKRGVSASSRVNTAVEVAHTTRGVAGTRALTSSQEQQAPRQSPRQSPPVAGAGTQEYAPPSQVLPPLFTSAGTPALKTALPPATASTEVACAVASPSPPTTIARRLLQSAVSPPVDDGEQLCATSTDQTLPADRCSCAIVSDAVAYKSGGKDKHNATDNSSKLSPPALVIPSEPADPVAAVVQPTATVSLSEESRADPVLRSSSVASPQRRELLQDLRKVEQPYLSQTNEHVQSRTSTGYASDFLRSAEGGSALETVVTQLHDVTTENGLRCREGEEGACTAPWTRSQQGPQARRTVGTSQPVASRMQHLLSCASASHPRAPSSARRPEAQLHNMPTSTLEQPLLADRVATQGIAYGFKEGEIKNSVERGSSRENQEREEYKGAGDGESKASAARFQKRELSHLMRGSEASRGTSYVASSGDKEALHAEGEDVETRDTQRHAPEGEAHMSTAATTHGVVVYLSSWARRREDASQVLPTCFESCPQTPAVNAGHNIVSCGVAGRILKNHFFSRTAEEHEKHPPDSNLMKTRRDGNKRANGDEEEGIQEGETITGLCQACSAELEAGREEGSSSDICVGTLSVQEHKGELESLTEVAQAEQDGKPSVPTGRSPVESSNEHTERENDRSSGDFEVNGSDTDGEVRLGGTEPCRGPQAGKSNEKAEKTQLAAAVAAAVQCCQSTSFVKDEGMREGTTSTTGSDSLVSTQGDKSIADKHSGGAWWKSSASLFSKAAAFEQTPRGDAFPSDKDIPAPGVNALVDKRATSALGRLTDTSRRGVPDAQTGVEFGRSTAIERAASASYTAAGGTELCAAREYAYAETPLSQRNGRDYPTDKAVHVESARILEVEQHAQIHVDSQCCDGTVAELKKGACQRGGLVSSDLKNYLGGTDIRSSKRLTISHNAGRMDVDIFSSQAAGGSPSHSPVGDIPLPGIQNSTQLEIVPYCHVQSRKPEHLHCSRLSPSDHLSKCELEAVQSPTVISKELPACRAPAVTTCMIHPLSGRSSAKLTSTCLGWTSRPGPLSRRPLSVRAVLSPPVQVAEPQSSVLLYSFSDASHEGLSLQRMCAKKPSAHGDVSQLINYAARSACAASEVEVPLVKDTCTGSTPWSELHETPGREGCGLRSHRDCLLQDTQHLVSQTLSAGRRPEAAPVCSSEKATPQSGTALQADVSVIPVPDTSRIPVAGVGSMLSLAAASPPYSPCTAISPSIYCSTRQRLPRSSATGSIRAVSALCTSAYKKDTLTGWETKLKTPGDSPDRWGSGRIGEVVKSRPSDSVADGSWELERNGEECHFPRYEAAGDPRGCERVRSCGNIPQVHDAVTPLTQALQDATSFFDSVDEALLSGFRDKTGSPGSDCVAGRDLCDTSSTSRNSPSVISRGRNEPRPPELSILASQSLTSGHDSAAQAKPNVVIHSRSQLRAFRKACVTAPFKPPAAKVSDCALMPASRFSRQTSTHHMTAKVSFGSGQPPTTSSRLLRRNTSHLESAPLARIPAGKPDVAASSVEVKANVKTVTDQSLQDLTLLLRVAGVAPGDVLEVRLPFPVTDGGNRQSIDAVGPKEMIHSKFGPRLASVPVKPSAYVATTDAPWQQIDEGGTRQLYDEPVNIMSFSSSPTCAREDLNVANLSHEALWDTGRNCSGSGTENAPVSETGCWVEAEVMLPETREIDQKSCRRIMQLTYKDHPGLSTKVVFLGFHHLLCLSTSLTLNGNETPQPKIRRVGGETQSCFLPFGDGRLLSTMDQKILEFRKPADFLVELNITRLCEPCSAVDVLGQLHADGTQAIYQSPAVDSALLKEFAKLPLVMQISVASRYGQFSQGFMGWMQGLVQRHGACYSITRNDVHRFASAFQLSDS